MLNSRMERISSSSAQLQTAFQEMTNPSLGQARTAPSASRGLTFVTPTLLAGDRSLADVVAHEPGTDRRWVA